MSSAADSSSDPSSGPRAPEEKLKDQSADNTNSFGDNDEPQAYEGPSRVVSRNVTRTSTRTSILARAITGDRGFDGVPTMGGGRPYPPMLEDREPYRVEFEGPDDPDNALNWPTWRKLRSAAPLSLAAICSTWTSAVYAPGIPEVKEHFHVGTVVAALGISLYVCGFAAGPILWGPMSEFYGRKAPLVIAYFLFTCFTFAAATAKDYQTLMLCRFFSGTAGSAPLVLVAAAFSDLFTTQRRGAAVILFCSFVIGGPLVAPVVGGYIANSYLGWRWTLYISGIMGGTTLVLIVAFLDETFGPSILARKARAIRTATGNWGVYAPLELVEFDISEIMHRTIFKPFRMLAVEPILLLLSLYHGYIYGLLYMLLEAIPIIFSHYKFKGGNLELPYLAMFIGTCLAGAVGIFFFEPLFLRKLAASGKPILPEARLPMMMLGTPCFTLGVFWLCWTGAYPEHVHWLAPVFGLGLFGFGFLCVFVPPFNYIVDSYLALTASAMAANAFIRGGMGAAFPLFATAMFNNLGVQWAGTLIGCLSALMLPVPFLFYRFGPVIRHKSKFAINMELAGAGPGLKANE